MPGKKSLESTNPLWVESGLIPAASLPFRTADQLARGAISMGRIDDHPGGDLTISVGIATATKHCRTFCSAESAFLIEYSYKNFASAVVDTDVLNSGAMRPGGRNSNFRS